MSRQAKKEKPPVLPVDPMDAFKLENDVLGVRVWGPASQPTLSIGRSDIWDRRWFADRQPLVTMDRIRELAMSDRLAEIVAADDENNTVYKVYRLYDFPCPKPGAQFILGTPFARQVALESVDQSSLRLLIDGGDGKRLEALAWVCLTRPLVVIDCRSEGLSPEDLWVRVWRHRDTIVPGEPVDPSVGGRKSGTDFDPLPSPRPLQSDRYWGVVQTMAPEPTFPDGFASAVAAAAVGARPRIDCREGQVGLGTPLWAEQEGRLGHGVVKRYTPLNEAPGAAATATFEKLPDSFTLLVAAASSHDADDPAQAAFDMLDSARKVGLADLRRRQERAVRRFRRSPRARAQFAGDEPERINIRQVRLFGFDGSTTAARPMEMTASRLVLPNLRRDDGYYGDLAICSVGATKFCFQDAALWHGDFHLNEIQAENLLTLGMFPELLSYCRMIRNLLDQACENAHDVYSLPGAMYPVVHFPLRCRGIAHTNLTWEQDMGLNGLVSKPLWLYYRHTGDREFLRDLAYPVLRECARFCLAQASEGPDGRLHIVPTVSPEYWPLTANFERNRDCTSALTLTRYLFKAAAQAAGILGCDPQDAVAWASAADRLAPYPTFETPAGTIWVDVAGAPPVEDNIPVPLSPVFWGDDVGLDSPPETLALARRTLDQIRIWEPHRGYLDSCIRPRFGIYDPAASIGPQNLLLSYQSIRVFPAVPHDVEIVMEDFAAEGGFRVSAVRTRDGRTADLRIRSTLGRTCRLTNPWPGESLTITTRRGKSISFTRHGEQTHFQTRANGDYLVKPK